MIDYQDWTPEEGEWSETLNEAKTIKRLELFNLIFADIEKALTGQNVIEYLSIHVRNKKAIDSATSIEEINAIKVS